MASAVCMLHQASKWLLVLKDEPPSSASMQRIETQANVWQSFDDDFLNKDTSLNFPSHSTRSTSSPLTVTRSIRCDANASFFQQKGVLFSFHPLELFPSTSRFVPFFHSFLNILWLGCLVVFNSVLYSPPFTIRLSVIRFSFHFFAFYYFILHRSLFFISFTCYSATFLFLINFHSL